MKAYTIGVVLTSIITAPTCGFILARKLVRDFAEKPYPMTFAEEPYFISLGATVIFLAGALAGFLFALAWPLIWVMGVSYGVGFFILKKLHEKGLII